MLKIMAQIEHTIGTRIYRLICDQDSPTSELKEALGKFTQIVYQIEDQARANAEAQESQTDIKTVDSSQPIEV